MFLMKTNTVHTTYIDIASIDNFLVWTCFIKSEFFSSLLSVITILYINNLLFSYIDINFIKVTGQNMSKTFTFLSLSECLMLACYTTKAAAIPLISVPLMP